MPRIYRVTFEEVAVTAAQDLVQISGAAGKMVRILRRWVGATDTTLPTEQMLALRERFLPATVTNGSGGTTPTITKNDPGDAAASATALVNNTTKATTSATAVVLNEASVDSKLSYDEWYLNPPLIGPGEAYVFELLSTVSGTMHLSGGVEIEESGG